MAFSEQFIAICFYLFVLGVPLVMVRDHAFNMAHAHWPHAHWLLVHILYVSCF